jgi:hypothetical protein
MRARTVTDEIRTDLVDALRIIRKHVPSEDEEAWAQIETFCAIALRVFAKTNPSKLRDAAMAEEIKARIEGREVLE